MSNGQVPEREFTPFLADHLELIEPGMTLVDTEVTLRDPDGASGRVDIVAHDRYGNVVVIEVKCSDHSAREAAHEIFKYSEILRSQQQIDESEFRCILVSTHWRELHRAFTDYAARHHDVAGYRAELADDAWSITRVEPLARSGSVVLTSAHDIFLYSDPAKRHDDFALISAALAKMGAPHQIGILMQNDVTEVMFPYALYVILGTAVRSPTGEDYPRDPAEHDILAKVLTGHHADDLEEGSPEKLGHLLSTAGGWHATEVLKAGAFARRDRLGVDDLLIRAAVEMPGFTNTAFVRWSSPSRPAHWAATRELTLGSMPTSPECREVVARWLDGIEQIYSEHTIAVRIRNPGIIRPLAELSPQDLAESPMSLRVAVLDAKTGNRVAGLVVALHWDGATVAGDLLAVIKETVEDYFAWSMFYPDPEDEAAALRRLGLRLHAYEIAPAEGAWLVRFKLELDAGALVRRDYDDLDFPKPGMVAFRWGGSLPFEAFRDRHWDAMERLRAQIAAQTVHIEAPLRKP
ncbi:hypothetical protein HNR22_003228 [Micromonospora jinlongensis]|uniref:Endonuclease NucS C-terminal domain-containing protein n=1 Tax=Micromonospora jinlongensis TaxID=1287877 RepID=A0A7Y9X1J0_9ACTN|nr:endonuclease NucS domain-containing protein [Micromonospora jinlongensis]NYH43501.1 hypothetical protein [Micromonospora jinlongensis]